MNDELRNHVLGIKTSNNELNERLKSYFTSDLNEKLSIFSALSQYLVAIEHKPKEKFEKVIGPILEDIKKMSEQKTNTKKIFSNFDGYMYYRHNLSLGKIEYENVVYDLDNHQYRRRLLGLLVQANVLEETGIYSGHHLDMQYQFKEEHLTTEFIKEKLHTMWLQEKPTVLTFRSLLEEINSKGLKL